jgi:tRNA pseudouridine13 synthase
VVGVPSSCVAIRTFPSDFQVAEQLTPGVAARLEGSASGVIDSKADLPDAGENGEVPGKPARPGKPASFHQWWRLDKVSLSTPEAIERFAKKAKIPANAISYVGLKDKHAQTSQYISTPVAHKDLAGPMPGVIEDTGPAPAEDAEEGTVASSWKATPLSRLDVAIAAEHVTGNAFTITVRRLNIADVKLMEERLERLRIADGEVLFTNYFGAQRFGSARHGAGFAGPCLVKGDYLGALKLLIATPARKDTGAWRSFTRIAAEHWPSIDATGAKEAQAAFKRMLGKLPNVPEKRVVQALAQGSEARDAFTELPAFLQGMCVEAYQSWLWNEAACRVMREVGGSPERLMVADQDEFTTMVFAEGKRVSEGVAGCLAALPHPGLSEDIATGDGNSVMFVRALKGVLAEQGLGFGDLKLPGLRRPAFIENARPLMARASGVRWTPRLEGKAATKDATAKPHSAVLAFALPRGSYATVLLRALGQ